MKKRLFTFLSILLFITLIFTSCGSNAQGEIIGGNYESSPGASSITSGGSVNIDTSTVTDRKIITTAYYYIESLEFATALNTLTAKVTELGGYVSESRVTPRQSDSYGRAYLTIRIPSAKTTEFSASLTGLGNITSSHITTEDVTLTYSDLSAKIAVLKAESQTLLDLMATASSVSETLMIREQYTEVQMQLKSYQDQLDTLADLVDEATFYVNLYDVKEYTPKGKDPTYLENVGFTFGDSFSSFLSVLEELSYVIIYVLPYILLIGVVLGTIFGVHILKKKKKAKVKEEKTKEDQTK